MGNSRTNEIEQCQTRDHADQPPQPQVIVGHSRERCHHALHALRAEKRQDTFENEIERKRREQARPVHVDPSAPIRAVQYLKKSLSGEMTRMSDSVPIDSRYASRLR